MKTLVSMMAFLISSAALANTTIRCEAPAGASSGVTLSLSSSTATVSTPNGEYWLASSRKDGEMFVFATLVSVRPTGSTFTWERIEFQIDLRVPTQATVYLSRLDNSPATPLNNRLLATYARPVISRVNCTL